MLDILIKNGRVLTLSDGLCRGDNIDLKILDNYDIAISNGKIEAVDRNISSGAGRVIDASGSIVIPGFIDAHTHALFGGSRVDEFEQKISGISYEEIMKRGGGIKDTVNKTRDLSKEDLLKILERNTRRMSETGTTTVEIKSGYGLNFETEMTMLEAINEFRADFIDVIPTYMGAHEFPEEISREEYLQEIIDKHIPEVSASSLTKFCDVFCEEGVYSREETEKILKTARDYGLRLKVHADELKESGGAEVAGKMGAVSAEHLIHPSSFGLDLMAEAGVIAVMLPSTSFILKQDKPPIESFREKGIPMALGTDFNPGSSPVSSIPMTMSLGCYHYGMTAEEVIAGVTINAAHTLLIENEVGSIEKGKRADILLLSYEDYREIPYWFGNNPVEICIKSGRICFERESC